MAAGGTAATDAAVIAIGRVAASPGIAVVVIVAVLVLLLPSSSSSSS